VPLLAYYSIAADGVSCMSFHLANDLRTWDRCQREKQGGMQVRSNFLTHIICARKTSTHIGKHSLSKDKNFSGERGWPFNKY
jgi:hypothetical protein